VRAILFRVIVPLVLFVAGIGSAIYGARYHVIAVIQENEEEVSIPVPTPFGPGPSGPEGPSVPEGPPAFEGPPGAENQGPGGEPPMGGPPPIWQPPASFTTVLKKTIVTTDELEPRILREVSVGGVTLAASGEILRTYTGEEGPALCPT